MNYRMVAYYMNEVSDPKAECRLADSAAVTLEHLQRAGVWMKKVDLSEGWEGRLDEEAERAGMGFRDEVFIQPGKIANYEDKLKIFFEEHLHTDPEVRFIKDGTGYFDIRDHEDKWIRIPVASGDLLFLPAGIYHRFTPDHKDFVHAIRLFKDHPKWEAFNRGQASTDDIAERKEYLNSVH